MVRKCGACAMLINERPKAGILYISTYVKRFYNHLGTFKQIPLVRDLIVDRSILFWFEKTEPLA